MPKPTLVTAVVPLHNHDSWVCGALDSIDSQDYENKSVVVVDDGSMDGSLGAVLRHLPDMRETTADGQGYGISVFVGKLPLGTPTVVVSYPKASGPAFARNRGMELAMANFSPTLFAFLDSDDLYEQGKLSKSVAKYLTAPELIGAVYSDYDTLRPDGLRLRQFKEGFARSRLVQECIVNCDSVVSTAAMKQCGGFDEELRVAEDYDLWLRLSEHHMIAHIPESLVTIRVGSHSSSSTVQAETWKRCHARVFEKLNQRARSRG